MRSCCRGGGRSKVVSSIFSSGLREYHGLCQVEDGVLLVFLDLTSYIVHGALQRSDGVCELVGEWLHWGFHCVE